MAKKKAAAKKTTASRAKTESSDARVKKSGHASASGLRASPDPRKGPASGKARVPAQQQDWPGEEGALRPKADHGEKDYRGSGRLDGRRALITGGDSGIGRAIAIAFAREGADVSIAYYNEHEDARETMRWVKKAGRTGTSLAGDLTDRAHCLDVVKEAVAAMGGLDLLINNAAVHIETEEFGDIDPAQLERTFATNILSFFWITQAALAHMSAGASIINTGSVVGMKGHASLIDYAATKGAVHAFTKSLAQAIAARGIRVNCVAPGPVWTPLIPSTREAKAVEGFGEDTFWKRPAQPAEVAPAYVFLASSDARFMTGEVMGVTGTEQTTR